MSNRPYEFYSSEDIHIRYLDNRHDMEFVRQAYDELTKRPGDLDAENALGDILQDHPEISVITTYSEDSNEDQELPEFLKEISEIEDIPVLNDVYIQEGEAAEIHTNQVDNHLEEEPSKVMEMVTPIDEDEGAEETPKNDESINTPEGQAEGNVSPTDFAELISEFVQASIHRKYIIELEDSLGVSIPTDRSSLSYLVSSANEISKIDGPAVKIEPNVFTVKSKESAIDVASLAKEVVYMVYRAADVEGFSLGRPDWLIPGILKLYELQAEYEDDLILDFWGLPYRSFRRGLVYIEKLEKEIGSRPRQEIANFLKDHINLVKVFGKNWNGIDTDFARINNADEAYFSICNKLRSSGYTEANIEFLMSMSDKAVRPLFNIPATNAMKSFLYELEGDLLFAVESKSKKIAQLQSINEISNENIREIILKAWEADNSLGNILYLDTLPNLSVSILENYDNLRNAVNGLMKESVKNDIINNVDDTLDLIFGDDPISREPNPIFLNKIVSGELFLGR